MTWKITLCRPPVLLAIDQVNHFYAKTAYHDIHSEILMPNRLLLVKAFQEALKGIRRVCYFYVVATWNLKYLTNTKRPVPNWCAPKTFQIPTTQLERSKPSLSPLIQPLHPLQRLNWNPLYSKGKVHPCLSPRTWTRVKRTHWTAPFSPGIKSPGSSSLHLQKQRLVLGSLTTGPRTFYQTVTLFVLC